MDKKTATPNRRNTACKTANGSSAKQKGASKPSRADVLADLVRVQQENPDVALTRNFYRAHGKYSEGSWQRQFPRFVDFVAAAGLTSKEDARKKTTTKAEVATEDNELIFKGDYVHNKDSDTYITFLDRAGYRIVLSGEQHRAMLQRYSNWDGEPSTINEICRDFGIRRDWFMEYKSVHGWTHDKEPFSNEELLERPEEDMVKDALQMRRLSLFKKFERRKWEETKTNADRWVNFEQNVMLPLMGHISQHASAYQAPMLKLKKAQSRFALVVNPFDLHYGKHGWSNEVGQGYSRKEARELLIEHTQRLAEQVARIGRPEKIICASASDWFHVDNQEGKTTSGTPQDCDGSRAQILIEGCELAKDHVDMLAQIAPVEWKKINGNHDYDSALSVMLYLQAWYRDSKRVQIDTSVSPRQYSLYGNSLLGWAHGNSLKPGDLHSIMTTEAKALWRKAEYYYFWTGHLHHKIQHEIHGLTHFQVASLSGSDRWHHNNGYPALGRALQGFMISEDRGIVGELISPIKASSRPIGVKLQA